MATTVTITCPHCGFSKDMPGMSVPTGPVRVSCPRCKLSFSFTPESYLPSATSDASPEPILSPIDSAAAPDENPDTAVTPSPIPFLRQEETREQVARTAMPGSPPRRELSSLGDLFSRSWDVFKNRIGILLVLYLIIIAGVLVPLGLFMGMGFLISMVMPESRVPLLVGGGITGGIIGMVAVYWGAAALVFAVVDESLGVRDALVKGWERLGSFLWLYSIAGFIILGGFLLFVVPGVIFLVWFFFGQFVLAVEGDRGMAALLKSKEYVTGRWLDVFFRLFVLWLISVVAGMIPLVGSFLSLLLVPFSMVYHYLIFAELKEIKGKVEVPTAGTGKYAWLGVGAFGHVVFLGLLGLALLQHFIAS
jgi:hypothetical protein